MTLDCISSSMLCFLWSRSAACWNNNKTNNNNNNTCWTLQLTTCCHRYRARTLYTRVMQAYPCFSTHFDFSINLLIYIYIYISKQYQTKYQIISYNIIYQITCHGGISLLSMCVVRSVLLHSKGHAIMIP